MQKKPPLLLRFVFLGKHLAYWMERRLAASGLNRTQAIVLTALHHHPGLQPLQLRRPAGVEAANVTRTLQTLERLGFVERRPHPTDRRASLFYLTAKGEDRARILSEEMMNLSAELFRNIDPGDMPALERTLQVLMAHLHQQHTLGSNKDMEARGEISE